MKSGLKGRIDNILVLIFPVLFLLAGANADDEARGFYAPVWEITSPSAIEQIISKARQYHFNQVYLQVRARGDAYYYPNRDDTAYENIEPRAQLYSLNPPDFDPLQYAIDLAHNGNPRIEVHTWVVVYPAWNRSYQPSSPNHVYRRHPEWITEDSSGVTQSPTASSEGAYLDPGIPAVQDYLFNVFLDIVRNYDIDGLHFDYSRYPSGDWGYDPVAKAQFQNETDWNIDTDTGIDAVWHNWKRAQISNLIRRTFKYIKAEKPWVTVSSFLPSFTDTVKNNYQAYNWWSKYGWLDVLQRGSYNNSASLSVSRYRDTQSYNYGGLPVQCPLGAQETYHNTPDSMIQIINSLRAETPRPWGFNHFQYSGLSANSDLRFKSLGDSSFRPDAPYPTWVSVPEIKPDTMPPNNPASASASVSVPGEVLVSFDRPTPAGDGDLPVQYRIYRDTDSNVEEYYSNLRMVFYDDPPVRTSFTWRDVELTGGITYYYKIVAYDDYFNQASVTLSATPNVIEIVVDNSDSGFSVISGSWSTGSSASDKYGVDYRYNGTGSGNDRVRWTPTLPSAGQYNLYVWYPQGSNRAPDAKYTLHYDGGSQTFSVNQQANGGRWNLLGSFQFNSGTSGYVELSDQSSATGKVVIADAVKFVYASGHSPTPWEVKPVATPTYTPPDSPIIVDNTPGYLHYEDGSGWASSTWGAVYGTDKHYTPSPTSTKASYVVYIPYPGQYAIDGWIHGNTSYAQHARYRFVHTGGMQESVVTQQHAGSSSSGDFWINVDGVSDAQAFSFEEGMVFITLFNTTSGDGYTIADALRFRFLSSTSSDHKEFWLLY
ncbi:family 10 glycosylhydrolase [Candidatus Sumerlaeota bacterium]|nr:family 10 glycosylhydrolase [Candidatus Sumerlaeota bacterium]